MFLFTAFVYSLLLHAIYISVIEIDTDQQTVAVKVFQDDFRDALRNLDSKRYKPSNIQLNRDLALEYFAKKLTLRTAGGKKLLLRFQEIEEVGDIYWVYFTYNQSVKDKLEVKATVFLELFPTQQNIVTVQKADKKYFTRLTQENTSEKFDF